MSELVEIVARHMCEWAGYTPDEKLQGDNLPSLGWMTFRKDARDFLRAIEGAGYEVGPGWQPIETAPRDGTWFLACCAGLQTTTRYVQFLFPDDRMPITSTGQLWPVPPTHWRPLPAPPAFDAAPTVGGE